jgi:hypothetical protein
MPWTMRPRMCAAAEWKMSWPRWLTWVSYRPLHDGQALLINGSDTKIV